MQVTEKPKRVSDVMHLSRELSALKNDSGIMNIQILDEGLTIAKASKTPCPVTKKMEEAETKKVKSPEKIHEKKKTGPKKRSTQDVKKYESVESNKHGYKV